MNRINILAKHASAGLLRHPVPLDPSSPISPLPSALRTYFASRISFLRFRLTLFTIDVAFHVTNWVAWITSFQRRIIAWMRPDWGNVTYRGRFEDKLEADLRDMARQKFGMQISDDAFET